MMAGPRSRWIRNRLVVVAAFIGLTAYVVVAIYMQPVARGNDEEFTGVPGHNPTNETIAIAGVARDMLIWPYVDGGVTTLVTSLVNNGPVGLSVTGIETNGRWPAWGGLFTLTGARAAVLANPGQCCELDQSATWSARDFRPIYLSPGHQGAVAAHILMSNCEYNSSGQYTAVEYIRVDYAVLGFQHVQKVGVGPYWIKSPDTCPRSGPARPA
jgi:hypothetical protein